MPSPRSGPAPAVGASTSSRDHRRRQLTPPGSACSITIGPLVVDEVEESSARFQLVVNDIEAARRELPDRGVEVSEVQQWGDEGPKPGHGGNYNAFVFFNDPDGNNWGLQEVTSRSFPAIQVA